MLLQIANRHRFLADHAARSDTQNDEPMEDADAVDEDMFEDEPLNYDRLIDGFQSLAVAEDGPVIAIDMELAAAAATPAEEEQEQLLMAKG